MTAARDPLVDGAVLAPEMDGAVLALEMDGSVLAPMIDPSRSALVVVDVQVDFVSPAGALAGFGLDVSVLEAPLARVEALIAAGRAAGVPIVFLRVITRPETDPVALTTRNARLGHPPEALAVCRAGTPGAAYFRVQPGPGDIEVAKPLYSGFVGTSLDTQLRAVGVDTLVFSGFTTECCVDNTVRDAFHRDYHCFVVADATGAYERRLHENALDALALSYALVVDSDAVLEAWAASAERATPP